jgi:GxxExxY protein
VYNNFRRRKLLNGKSVCQFNQLLSTVSFTLAVMIIKKEFKYSDITGRVIGAAMEVHKILGNGFQEVIYQRCLEKELKLQGLSYQRELEMPIFYKGERIGKRRVDFLIQGVVSVELKAVTKLEDVHLAQAINYLEAYNLEIGVLINFGTKSLEFRRLINSRFTSQPSSVPS